jgi:bifunctional DNA-binding transcriptional regulator/antitoxin component of YhaV-PrlF toxin-antitoxin module
MTLPVEVRRVLNIQSGDEIEIYTDHRGEFCLRPLTSGPLDFLKDLPVSKRNADIASDDDAIALAVTERNMRSLARNAAK